MERSLEGGQPLPVAPEGDDGIDACPGRVIRPEERSDAIEAL